MYRTLMETLPKRLNDTSVNPVEGAIQRHISPNENMYHAVSSNKRLKGLLKIGVHIVVFQNKPVFLHQPC
jgi:hypothetical protein